MKDTPTPAPDLRSYVMAAATFGVISTALSVVYFWLTPPFVPNEIWYWPVVVLWCLVVPGCWIAIYASAREAHDKAARLLLWSAPFALQGPILFLAVPYGFIIVVCSFQRCDF